MSSEDNTADQLMTSVQVIPPKIVLVGWLHTPHRAVNQEENFHFRRKRKTAISPPIFSLFQKFSWKIRDYSSITTLTQKSKFEKKNAHLKV